jgi:hypothetical protein
MTGGCPCGAVRYRVSEQLLGAIYCHCERCQRRTGSAFGAVGLTAPGSFEVTDGEDRVTAWDPGEGSWTKRFCSNCGGHLYVTSPDGSMLAVHLGSLDADPGVRPAAHQFTDHAASWLPLPDDGLPRFGQRPPAYQQAE